MPVNESEIVRRMEVQPAHPDDEPLVGGVRFFRGLSLAIVISGGLWLALCAVLWVIGK